MKKSSKKILGICSSHIIRHKTEKAKLNYETNRLLKEGKKIFDEVILINPLELSYEFLKRKKRPIIKYDKKDISNLSCLIVRGTSGYENAIATFAHAIILCGCYLVDPLDRFSGSSSSKLLTTIERFEKNVGIDSFYSFSYKNAINQIENIFKKKDVSFLVKPIKGKKGKGIRLLSNKKVALESAKLFFEKNKKTNIPFFLQKYEELKEEYRVMIIDSKCMGMVKKIPKPGSITANYAQGATFVQINDSQVKSFTIDNVKSKGLLGVDIGRNLNNKLFVIEANRAPQWKHFEKVTGINVARKVLDYAIKQL